MIEHKLRIALEALLWGSTERNVSKIADSILSLPEMKELMEKAELLDMQYPKIAKYFSQVQDKSFFEWMEEEIEKAEKYDTIMSGLVVEEKCEHNKYAYELDGETRCSFCHGKGYTTRPATPEEVRELVKCFFKGLYGEEGIANRTTKDDRGFCFLLDRKRKMRSKNDGDRST